MTTMNSGTTPRRTSPSSKLLLDDGLAAHSKALTIAATPCPTGLRDLVFIRTWTSVTTKPLTNAFYFQSPGSNSSQGPDLSLSRVPTRLLDCELRWITLSIAT